MPQRKIDASCREEIIRATKLTSQTRRYGGVRYRKKTTLPLEKVTPLEG